MKKHVFFITVAVLAAAAAVLACATLPSPPTAEPIFEPEATEVRPPTTTPVPSPTPEPIEVDVIGLGVYKSWEDNDRVYETPPGYIWLAVEVRVLSGDPEATFGVWSREDTLPAIVTADGFGASDGTIVYTIEDGMLFVFRVPSTTSIVGLMLVMPDGKEFLLEGFFQQPEPEKGPRA